MYCVASVFSVDLSEITWQHNAIVAWHPQTIMPIANYMKAYNKPYYNNTAYLISVPTYIINFSFTRYITFKMVWGVLFHCLFFLEIFI